MYYTNPTLLLITVKSFTSFIFNAFIKFTGIPHNPNPERGADIESLINLMDQV